MWNIKFSFVTKKFTAFEAVNDKMADRNVRKDEVMVASFFEKKRDCRSRMRELQKVYAS